MHGYQIKLMFDSFTEEEFNAVNEVLKSGFYTQGDVVSEFERAFAEWNGSKYAVMVNSGSSANLLIIQALKERYALRDGDEVLVPAVTWPTTVYPIIQNNLVPVFCDVDGAFNLSIESMRRMTTEKTKAIFVVHLLGQPANMEEIRRFCDERKIIIVEDTCESLGAQRSGVKAGNIGVMSAYSFYFGHHMTTIEGGMITTDDPHTFDILKSTRSHGWVRNSLRAEKYQDEKHISDFLFDLPGYNLRSTNVNAAIGLVQLKKLDSFIATRKRNHEHFLQLVQNRRINLKVQEVAIDQTSSFCFGIIFETKETRNRLLQELKAAGIECRPLVAGNLLRQPVFAQRLKGTYRADICVNADRIHDCGMYLPNNQFITREHVTYMVDKIEELLQKN